MTEALLIGIAGAVVLLALIMLAGLRIVSEYERAVIFRLGRVIGAKGCLLYTSPSPRDRTRSRMPSSA